VRASVVCIVRVDRCLMTEYNIIVSCGWYGEWEGERLVFFRAESPPGALSRLAATAPWWCARRTPRRSLACPWTPTRS
jgi:hypothetical protein